MIESTLERQLISPTYPTLFESKNIPGLIILVFEDSINESGITALKGTVVSKKSCHTWEYRENWDANAFQPYFGSVTIKNI